MRFVSAFLSLSLTALLAYGQTAGLDLRVLENQSSPDGIRVEVSDATGKHVAGATVVFRLPNGSVFADGKQDSVAQSDNDGMAQVNGIRWGAPGEAAVRITASKETVHAGLIYEKTITGHSPVVAPAQTQPKALPLRPAVPLPQQQEAAAPVPGVIVVNDDPNANVPIRPLVAEAAGGPLSPRLSIVSSGKGPSDHHLRNRILIGVAVAAGTGAAIILAHNIGHSTSSSGSGVTIGPPTVSVGH